MAYTPTVWETGDVITAEKLNKAEQGIAAAADQGLVVVPLTYDDDASAYVTDADFSDVKAAFLSGRMCAFAIVEDEKITPHYYYISEYSEQNIGPGVVAGSLFSMETQVSLSSVVTYSITWNESGTIQESTDTYPGTP